MSNLKPRNSGNSGSNSNSNMVRQQMPPAYQIGEMNSASGSRSVRESGNGNGGGVIDNLTDHNSLRATRSRPLARLDRLLRRWLPGYNYLRGSIANGSAVNTNDSPETETAIRPSLAGTMEQQRSGRPITISVEPALPVRKRKDGEVVLDTGIAKSEFCMKLEKLLRAKLIVKD